ncbi:MAG: uncharacterized protein JWO69_1154, partial [Thermoleophilia bacterium]|nr:uncharacterized protein [Thermoleophilia bacterium]
MTRPAGSLLVAACAALLASGCGSDDAAATGDAAPSFEATSGVQLAYDAFPSLQRLTPGVEVTAGADQIELTAARGEREGGQVVVWPTKGAARVVPVASALRRDGGGGLPAGSVTVYYEQAMEVEQGSPAGRAGQYLDPLVPAAGRAVELREDARMPMWVDVAVPVGAKAGRYRGAVQVHHATKGGKVRADTDALATIPIAVTVRDATLPHRPTLHSNVGVEVRQVARFEGVAEGSIEQRDALDAYARVLAEARLSIADVGVLPPGTLPGEQARPGDAAYLEEVFTRRGVASVRLPFYMTYPFADPLGADRAAAVRYLRASAAWARRIGVLERAYVYAIDE